MRLVLLFLVALGTSAAGAATMGASVMVEKKMTTAIDSEAIRDAIWLESDAVQVCYQSALKSIPGLKGKMVVSFDVDQAGKAKNFKRETGTILNHDIFACVAKALEVAEFPPAAVGTVVRVKYPFVFRLSE